jgi:hypothetical protein
VSDPVARISFDSGLAFAQRSEASMATPDSPERKPRPHHRPKALKVLDENWRENLPPFVPANWRPLEGVPATRADCPSERSACGHVKCRYHLWTIDGRDRPGRRISPRDSEGKFLGRELAALAPDAKATPAGTILRPVTPTACALAVVEHNKAGMDYDAIGRLLGICGERCRQIAVAAARKLGGMRALLGA